MWTYLGITSIALLIIYFFAGKNAVWGSLTIGIILGPLIAFFFAPEGQYFSWLIGVLSCIMKFFWGIK